MTVCCPGHVGDGNMHPTVVFDRTDPAAAERAVAAFGAVMDLGLEPRRHHHRRARHRPAQAAVAGDASSARPALALQRGVKELFDPDGLLNPGAVLPDR